MKSESVYVLDNNNFKKSPIKQVKENSYVTWSKQFQMWCAPLESLPRSTFTLALLILRISDLKNHDMTQKKSK